MSGFLTISLNNVRFRAFHGLYAEERKNGNEFEVSLRVSYEPALGLIIGIGDTINYESVFELLAGEMQKPRDLLETFVMEMAEILHVSFSRIKKIEISIIKLNPPIAGFTGNVEVKYRKEY
jgi:dihydroneopterin aldolase